MLNHQYRKKISWVVNPQTGRLQFVTEEDVHRGSEVFNNYGPKGNEELLLGYGFCIPDNPQDSFMVKTTLPASDPLASLKKDLLDFYGIPNVHPLNAHPNPSVFSALRVAVMNEVELYFHDRVQPVPPSTKEVIPMQNLRNELEMLKMLRSLISYKLQQLSAIGFEGVEREDMPTENIANAITYLQGKYKFQKYHSKKIFFYFLHYRTEESLAGLPSTDLRDATRHRRKTTTIITRKGSRAGRTVLQLPSLAVQGQEDPMEDVRQASAAFPRPIVFKLSCSGEALAG